MIVIAIRKTSALFIPPPMALTRAGVAEGSGGVRAWGAMILRRSMKNRRAAP
ncbi:MAG: hypothetical protein KGJ91_10340 [Xanthomonadaceae bacterium]|nr:hypothetical protein [Xanthomonadaceae bacterium]